jgi:co-chaperonin GroES (HSP10)
MSFKPLNRHIRLEPIEEREEEKESAILVPDNYKVKTSPYSLYKVLAVSKGCSNFDDGAVNKNVLVNNSMVEEIKVNGETYYLLLENYVYGLFE